MEAPPQLRLEAFLTSESLLAPSPGCSCPPAPRPPPSTSSWDDTDPLLSPGRLVTELLSAVRLTGMTGVSLCDRSWVLFPAPPSPRAAAAPPEMTTLAPAAPREPRLTASGDGAGDRLWLDFDCLGSFLDRLVSDNDMSFLTASGLLAPNLELACPTLFFPSEKVEETRLGVGDGGRPPPDPTDLSDGVLPM